MLSSVQAGPSLPKAAAHARRGEGDEGVAAAGLHLHQQRLALVQGHAAGIADRLTPPRLGQAGLVERVAGLVQHAHQRAGEIRLVVARGDAHVVGGAAGEGMGRDVEAAVMKVEADPADQLLAQPALRLDRERAFQRQRFGPAVLALDHAPQQIGQEAAQLVEQGVDARRAPARLEFVEQRVVERGAECRGLGLADATHDVQDFGERRQQRLEVGILLRRTPGQLAGRAGPRAGLDEVGRQGTLMHPGAAHLAQVGGLPRVERGPALLRARQEIGHLRRGDHLVGDHAQRRELVGAIAAGAVGHHGRAIPVQDRRRATDIAQPGEAALELGIGIVGDHGVLRRPLISSRPFSQ